MDLPLACSTSHALGNDAEHDAADKLWCAKHRHENSIYRWRSWHRCIVELVETTSTDQASLQASQQQDNDC
jgi:hypothetical protein